MIGKVAAILSAGLLAACSVVGVRSGTEEPRYIVQGMIGAVELRRYETRLAAETLVPGTETEARSEGFSRLARYIFGGNRSQARIAMTAPVAQASQTIAMTGPVAQTAGPGGWRIRFFLPASLTLATAPVPNDPDVVVVEVPAETMAVLRFTGSTSPEAVAVARQQLLAALAAAPWQPVGDPVAWFYDPPWTLPPLRRNEVAVPVAPR